ARYAGARVGERHPPARCAREQRRPRLFRGARRFGRHGPDADQRQRLPRDSDRARDRIMTTRYPRDLRGYGRNRPHARWPGNARIAVQFVLNYEEGGESCVLHGDPGSEQFLSELFNPAAFAARHLSMESIYEYG